MSVWAFPSFLSAAASLLLAAILFGRRKDGPVFPPFILLMAVMACIHGLNGMSAVFENNPIIWKKVLLLGEITLPVMIGYIGHSLSKNFSSNPGELGSWWLKGMAGGAVILGMLVMGTPDGFMQINHEEEIVFKRPEGLAIWGFILVAMCIGVSRLGQILQSFRDPLRYRVKYVLIGLGGLACISIVQAIQLLLVPVWNQDFVWAGGIAAFSSILFLGFGLGRWQVQHVIQKVHMSHHAVYTALAVLFVCMYLFLVGMVTVVIQQTGWEAKEALGVVLVFLAGLGLVVVMLSRHARAEFRQFVSRHFFRTKYDYREKWLEVTETFTACRDVQQIWNRFLEWLSRTFGTSQVTIWKYFDVDGRYHQIRMERRRRKWRKNERSPTIRDPLPIPESHPIILHMKEQQEPVLIKEGEGAVEDWREFLHVSQAHVCVPLLTGDGRLLGFCTLSKELPDEEYDQDDFDLLRAIAHHVTMLLLQFQLQEERSSSAKWEAVYRFAGFYMHDLKNLAGSLSLLVQNADQYENDPEFQASAMRTIRNTSQRIIDLMGELATQAKEPNPSEGAATQAVNVNILIKETLATINGSGCTLNFHPGQEVPMLPLKAESVKQVLLNLILNAHQATGEHGTIDISTAYDGERVIIEIVDTGIGMSASQLENLFQPFQSSKQNGLGVGLFQCKRIVEDHQGLIHIESQKGRGTTVIISFPVKNADNSRTIVPGVSTTGVGYGPRRNG
jgi:putative PEP-CTERM system histidine kinase